MKKHKKKHETHGEEESESGTYFIPLPTKLNFGQAVALRQGMSRQRDKKGFSGAEVWGVIKEGSNNNGWYVKGSREKADCFYKWLQGRVEAFQYSGITLSMERLVDEEVSEDEEGDIFEVFGTKIPSSVLDNLVESVSVAYQKPIIKLHKAKTKAEKENVALRGQIADLERRLTDVRSRKKDEETSNYELRAREFEEVGEFYTLLTADVDVDDAPLLAKGAEDVARSSAHEYICEKRRKKVSIKYVDQMLAKAREAHAFFRRVSSMSSTIKENQDKLKEIKEVLEDLWEVTRRPLQAIANIYGFIPPNKEYDIKGVLSQRRETKDLKLITKKLKHLEKHRGEYEVALELLSVYEKAHEEQETFRAEHALGVEALVNLDGLKVPVDLTSETIGPGINEVEIHFPNLQSSEGFDFREYVEEKLFDAFEEAIVFKDNKTSLKYRVGSFPDEDSEDIPLGILKRLGRFSESHLSPLGLRLAINYEQK